MVSDINNMDDTEVFIKTNEFKNVFSNALDMAEMVLNKEIIDSPVVNFEDQDIELYKSELKLGYILCQNDLIATIYRFMEARNKMFIRVEDIFEELEKSYIQTEKQIDIYLEDQYEKGVYPIIVSFQDDHESMKVVQYGASLFMAALIDNITQTIIQKIVDETLTNE